MKKKIASQACSPYTRNTAKSLYAEMAACMAMVGAYVQRFDLVYSGQIIPKFSGWNDLPQFLHYFPSGAELIIVVGAFGLMGFGFLLGERFVGKLFSLY